MIDLSCLSLLLYVLLGIVTGLFSGILGIGGGLVVVPGLAFIFTLSHMPIDATMHMAAGTSLAIMIVTATSAIISYQWRGNIPWKVVLKLLPGIIVGVVAGVFLASFLSTRILELLFGLFLLIISIQMIMLMKPKPTRTLPRWWWLISIGLLIGGKSGLLGVGGGAITIPFLTYCNVPMRKASGASITCTLPIAIVGSLCFMVSGWHALDVPHSIGYVYWPAFISVSIASLIFAPIGVILGHRMRTHLLKRLFGIFLLFVSLHLLF